MKAAIFVKRLFAVFASALTLMSMQSCIFDKSNNEFNGGQLLDSEMLSKIQGELIILENEEMGSADATETTGTESDVSSAKIDDVSNSCSENYECDIDDTLETEKSNNNNGSIETSKSESDKTVVYWTEGGGKWHLNKNCSFIKDSLEVIKGSVSEAKKAGKKSVCKTCEKSISNKSNVETSQDAQSITVYWTESGSKWHLYEDCGSLKKATKVISGSISEAQKAKKEDVCKNCSKRQGGETETDVTN